MDRRILFFIFLLINTIHGNPIPTESTIQKMDETSNSDKEESTNKELPKTDTGEVDLQKIAFDSGEKPRDEDKDTKPQQDLTTLPKDQTTADSSTGTRPTIKSSEITPELNNPSKAETAKENPTNNLNPTDSPKETLNSTKNPADQSRSSLTSPEQSQHNPTDRPISTETTTNTDKTTVTETQTKTDSSQTKHYTTDSSGNLLNKSDINQTQSSIPTPSPTNNNTSDTPHNNPFTNSTKDNRSLILDTTLKPSFQNSTTSDKTLTGPNINSTSPAPTSNQTIWKNDTEPQVTGNITTISTNQYQKAVNTTLVLECDNNCLMTCCKTKVQQQPITDFGNSTQTATLSENSSTTPTYPSTTTTKKVKSTSKIVRYKNQVAVYYDGEADENDPDVVVTFNEKFNNKSGTLSRIKIPVNPEEDIYMT